MIKNNPKIRPLDCDFQKPVSSACFLILNDRENEKSDSDSGELTIRNLGEDKIFEIKNLNPQ
jgi:hypothetical protein